MSLGIDISAGLTEAQFQQGLDLLSAKLAEQQIYKVQGMNTPKILNLIKLGLALFGVATFSF